MKSERLSTSVYPHQYNYCSKSTEHCKMGRHAAGLLGPGEENVSVPAKPDLEAPGISGLAPFYQTPGHGVRYWAHNTKRFKLTTQSGCYIIPAPCMKQNCHLLPSRPLKQKTAYKATPTAELGLVNVTAFPSPLTKLLTDCMPPTHPPCLLQALMPNHDISW